MFRAALVRLFHWQLRLLELQELAPKKLKKKKKGEDADLLYFPQCSRLRSVEQKSEVDKWERDQTRDSADSNLLIVSVQCGLGHSKINPTNWS